MSNKALGLVEQAAMGSHLRRAYEDERRNETE